MDPTGIIPKKFDMEIDAPLSWKNLYEGDAIVIVLGKAGSGKSMFINNAVGRGASSVGREAVSESVSISHFTTSNPKHPDRRIILVDTPGFNAGLWEDQDVLQRLVKWLKKSLPPKSSRSVAIVYLLEIEDHLSRRNELQTLLSKLSTRGISANVVISATERNVLLAKDVQRRWEEQSKAYNCKVHSFDGTQKSAQGILGNVSDNIVDVTEFQRNLASVLPAPWFRWPQFLARLLPLWVRSFIGLNSNSIISRRILPGSSATLEGSEVPSTAELPARLDVISERLRLAFEHPEQYQRLLSCKGLEAQSLLDTFQLILTNNTPDRRSQQNLILATKQLSSLADLYPTSFNLSDVQRLFEQPVTSGGYADIYKGIFKGKPVCLKTIRVYQTSSYRYILKIIAREAVGWGQLSHPNILPLYGLHWSGRQLSLVYPWAENGNVVDFVRDNPNASRVLLCSDVAEGIAYLHDNDIVHGDLKGTSILVDESCRAYVADFGISAVTDPEILNWGSQSILPSTGGTVRWQAPELLELEYRDDDDAGLRTVNTKATDVYAWACICYETFTGRVPFFEYVRDYLVMRQIIAGARPTRLSRSRDQHAVWDFTDSIWALMNDCWERDPAQRPNIAQVLSRLADSRTEDPRSPREWKSGPFMLSESLNDSDPPLTSSALDAILVRGLSLSP